MNHFDTAVTTCKNGAGNFRVTYPVIGRAVCVCVYIYIYIYIERERERERQREKLSKSFIYQLMHNRVALKGH